SVFFFSSRRRHTRLVSDWSSDVCSSDLDPFDVKVHAEDLLVGEIGAALAFDRLVVLGDDGALERVQLAVGDRRLGIHGELLHLEIGRASCRGRGESWGGDGALNKVSGAR